MTVLETIAGVAHAPDDAPAGAVLLTHGAGGDRDAAVLIALCEEWARHGWLAIRYNLPFRRRRATGPPSNSATSDQAGIAEAIALARTLTDGPVIAGGHSYGGRLTSMVAAADPALLDGLVLSSYPLHPPGKPERLRVEHFGAIAVPTVFTHGSADPFGSLAELRDAAALIPAPTAIVEIAGARHDLGFSKAARTKVPDVAELAVAAVLRLTGDGGLR